MGEIMTNDLSERIALHSGDYVESYDRKPINRVVNLTTLMNINDGDIVGDFACGNGMLLDALGPRTGLYHGVDFSPDFIASANKRAEQNGSKNYEFFCKDIIEYCESRREQYDIAATLDFSEHIDDPTFIEIYSAIRSSMKFGARMYIHTPNLEFIVERLKDIGLLKQFPEHIGVRNEGTYRVLLKESGFQNSDIKITTIPHYNVLKFLHPFSKLPIFGGNLL